jgi:hypothetical protein
LKTIRLVLIWLACRHLAWAESRPEDSSLPSQPPRFAVGLRVKWSDGSLGHVIGSAAWEQAGVSGTWVYPVQFGGPDSLVWSLPEPGLEFVDE